MLHCKWARTPLFILLLSLLSVQAGNLDNVVLNPPTMGVDTQFASLPHPVTALPEQETSIMLPIPEMLVQSKPEQAPASPAPPSGSLAGSTTTENTVVTDEDAATKAVVAEPVVVEDVAVKDTLDETADVVQGKRLADPCYQAWQQKTSSQDVTCQDHFLTNQLGPKLVILPTNQTFKQPFAISKQALSEQSYAIYCLLKGGCEALDQQTSQAKRHDKSFALKLDLSDIEATIRDYNIFCTRSSQCKGLLPDDMDRPILRLSYAQAVQYADWLSQQTGYVYRVPTEAEWIYALQVNGHDTCAQGDTQDAHDLSDQIPKPQTNTWGLVNWLSTHKEWVGQGQMHMGTQGPLVARRGGFDCSIVYHQRVADYRDGNTGVRLLREIH